MTEKKQSGEYKTTIGFNAGEARFEPGDTVTADQLKSDRAIRDLLEMGAIVPADEMKEEADASRPR